MKITSFSLNNFAPEEFFGGAKSVSMNGPKFSKSDRTMKAFSFVERNYTRSVVQSTFCMFLDCKQSVFLSKFCKDINEARLSSLAKGTRHGRGT